MTIPMPPVNLRSRNPTGKGFTMSKTRNNRNAMPKSSHELCKRMVAVRNPATSSMTTCGGSGLSRKNAARPDTQIAAARKKREKRTLHASGQYCKTTMRGTAPKVPKVPGADGRRPVPNHVARINAVLSEAPPFLKRSFVARLSAFSLFFKFRESLRCDFALASLRGRMIK